MTHHSRLSLVPVLVLVLGSAAAYAEDFNFTVPVQASNLPPNVEGLTVSCAALTPARFSNGQASVSETLVAAQVRVAITGGAYRGDVVVRATAPQGKDPRDAIKYRCEGWFDGHERGVQTVYFRTPTLVFPLASGAPFSLSSFGNLPR
ncbi:MAG: hypothetical protein ABI768_09700 [Acidobacteriota bacterium]